MALAIDATTPERGRPTDPLPPGIPAWQRRPMTQIVAALGAILPLAFLTVWMYVLRDAPPTLTLMLIGPLAGGVSLSLWILFLHRRVCGDRLDTLGFHPGRPWLDLGLGVLAGMGLLGFQFLVWNGTLGRLFPPRPPAEEVIELIAGLARNPWLLALWLGPVVWIGVAFFEELLRAFLLRRLWQVLGGPTGRWAAVLMVSALVGAAHGYQGRGAAASLGAQSVLLGWLFMATGRIRALIVAHALFDSAQVAFAVVMIRQMQP